MKAAAAALVTVALLLLLPRSTAAAGHHRRQRVVAVARSLIGVPYVWGGASPSGFDCSGLVQYVFAKVGVRLPHSTWGQMQRGRRVRHHLEVGDVVFFSRGEHVAIYLGDGQIEDAPHTGLRVGIRLLAAYGTFYMARRYL